MKTNLLSILGLAVLMSCASTDKFTAGQKGLPLPFITDSIENGEKWVYNSVISDEFENRFDTVKWYDYNPTWMGRQPSLFRKSNVRVENGELILTGKREEVPGAPAGYHTFTSAAVQSKTKVLYGYFEIKCKPMYSSLSSAFWLYTRDAVKQEEIDIFEICGRHDEQPDYEKTYYATSHYMLHQQDLHISDHVAHLTEGRWADQWITAGFKWTRDELVWYVNGKEIRRRHNDFWHSPETINFDSEAFPEWWGLPTEADQGGEFRIQYFRYWNEKDTPSQKSVYVNDMTN